VLTQLAVFIDRPSLLPWSHFFFFLHRISAGLTPKKMFSIDAGKFWLVYSVDDAF